MKFTNNVDYKKCAPKLIFVHEKKIENDSDNFWRGKLTLKVRNWQFSITWFRAGVDLPEKFSYEKVLFFTQLSYHLMCKLLKKSYMLSKLDSYTITFGLLLFITFYSFRSYLVNQWYSGLTVYHLITSQIGFIGLMPKKIPYLHADMTVVISKW